MDLYMERPGKTTLTWSVGEPVEVTALEWPTGRPLPADPVGLRLSGPEAFAQSGGYLPPGWTLTIQGAVTAGDGYRVSTGSVDTQAGPGWDSTKYGAYRVCGLDIHRTEGQAAIAAIRGAWNSAATWTDMDPAWGAAVAAVPPTPAVEDADDVERVIEAVMARTLARTA